jgi:hypothetical protein
MEDTAFSLSQFCASFLSVGQRVLSPVLFGVVSMEGANKEGVYVGDQGRGEGRRIEVGFVSNS